MLKLIQCENGVVTAQLMSATKPIRTFAPSPVPVHSGLSSTWAETPKTCFLASGLNNDLFCLVPVAQW